jgi:biotin-dependent carboxylase-like uncharacterized protein
MTIRVEKPGLQTTIQGRPRTGSRHLGVPASGPADPLSMALANRLLGNSSFVSALETTLTGATLVFDRASAVAISGATARCLLNGEEVQQHSSISIRPGDKLEVGGAEQGVRSYIAFAGGLGASEFLGSTSTYATAGFGGHEGRALKTGDEIKLSDAQSAVPPLRTPDEYRLPMLNSVTLRAGRSAETSSLVAPENLFDRKYVVASRSDRMGIKLDGEPMATESDGRMASAPLFPGHIQCPQDGSLFIMSVDAGTTGGYPRVAKITRTDMHMLGQLRPGSNLTLIERSDEDAIRELREKHRYWEKWLPDIRDVI